MKTLKNVLIALTLSAVFGCGGGLNGTYKGTGAMGMVDIQIKFISSSKAQITGGSMGMSSTSEVEYEKSGNEVKFIANGKNDIYTLDDNGCLTSGETKLCKVD
ncbi:MAG: hypothetical protein EOP00_18775 [Pedobacter sp.]|nr:MAG: hypothetical protein EOP00_18775 [Pedobacter sp.]